MSDAPSATEATGSADAFYALALQDLQARRQALESEISDLQRRRDQLEQELTDDLPGKTDAVARRLKGFQDYLVGALQDLVSSASQMELVVQPLVVQPSPLDLEQAQAAAGENADPAPAAEPATGPAGAAAAFAADTDLIRDRLGRFLEEPDFYADPWQLRRSLDPRHAPLLEDWFLSQGGRGAQPSGGNRSRNALITAAAIAILGELYGDRFQTLVLASRPERLGEWRRCLQDALGLTRDDFGPSSGIVLFERPDALVDRADRLEERDELPFIVIDAAEQVVEIPVLQFPLWLAFAAGPGELGDEEDLL
ncbi:DUF3086 domain-containing protein [Synechococcus sp. RSCCF101]|uniref:DUF3086 domain-containing protein n=1 Tax=Synechococcus sp. RSCCF101 TaxID=2511069 RepID=UPI001CDA2FD4|nr:DUF3086 domain-containing protein [Synechococcus sp. RSCCF101]